MTTYTINLTNGNLLTTIAPQTTDVNHTPITLFGQGLLSYGQNYNDNLVHMVEHFANSSAPTNPIIGTLWYDTAFHIFRVWNGTSWIALRPDNDPPDAGIATVLIDGAPSVVGLMSQGKLIATVSDRAVVALSLPSQINFRDTNYAFSARFPSGIGPGITVATDVELSTGDNSDTLVTAKWVKLQGYVTSIDGGGIVSGLGYTPLNPANNLSDVANVSTSRTHLGLGTIATQNTDAVAFSGGTMNGVVIGGGTPASGVFTTIAVTGSQSQHFVLAAPNGSSGAPSWRQLLASDIIGLVSVDQSNVAITGGSINGTPIGGTTPAASTFTTLALTGSQSQHFALAAPSGSAGAPSWRQLIASDISGLGTITTQDASAVVLTGGTINGTIIGGTTPASATFTTLALTGSQSQHFALAAPSGSAGSPSWRQLGISDISGVGTMSAQSASAVVITGGTIDSTAIGNGTPSTGSFTSATANAYNVGINQVVTSRQTGWTAPTGSVSRAGYTTGGATLTQVAEALAALIDDLITHGLIGT